MALALGLLSGSVPALTFPAPVVSARIVPRQAIRELIQDLTDELTRKELDTAQRTALIQQLASEFALAGSKDRVAIVKALERCLSTKVTGKADLELADLTVRALAAMAPESVPALTRAVENRSLMKDGKLSCTLVMALGKTRDKGVLRSLTGLLDHAQPELVATAGEALGEFELAALETRKKLFEEVLKTLASAKDSRDAALQTAAHTNGMVDASCGRRYDLIEPALLTALARLSHQEARGPELWQSWWNKNKRGNWEEKPKLAKT
jgi:HEAT repeat protein